MDPIGTSRGFRIFSTEPFANIHDGRDAGYITIAEMLFSTALVATVSTPRRVEINHTQRGLKLCDMSFATAVLAVRLNRKRLVVVLEDEIYLYDIQTLKLMHTLETSPNPAAIVALSPSTDNCYLACPLPQKAAPQAQAPAHAPPNSTHVPPTTGEVLLFDAIRNVQINVVEAHLSPLSCISFNYEGTMMATASDKGTIVRIFSVPDGHKLYQFRRGSMPSRIISMAFNVTSSLLCVSSATETVHIFKLGVPHSQQHSVDSAPTSPNKVSSAVSRRLSQGSDTLTRSRTSESLDEDDDLDTADKPSNMSSRKANGTLFGLIRRTSQNVSSTFATTVGGYLPKTMAEMWEPARDFAWIRLPKSASGIPASQIRSVVAMSPNAPHVMVVTNEGNFYVFQIDLSKGGEGTLIKQYS
jgi:autophagy-related protein 18